jgi:hypothetical protein
MSGDSLYGELMDVQLQMAAPVIDEVMIADARDGLRPSQMVERKLVVLLKATSLPMSCLQMNRTSRAI